VKVDWNASLAELSREEMITFLGDAFALIKRAIQARDVGKKLVTKAPPDATAAGCDAPWDDGVPVLS
jgi:hypothetical protein